MKELLNRILPLSKKASINQINIMNHKLFLLQSELSEIQEKIINIEKLMYYQFDKDKYPELLRQWYMDKTGDNLDLKNPKTYNEKIQWLKLYDNDPRKIVLSDKYLVREWIKDKIGGQYLIPVLGVYQNTDDIDFDALPDSFVIKANHGSGWNQIVKNKKEADIGKIKEFANTWMKTNYAFVNGYEMQYSSIQRKIIVEEYLEDKNGDLPDYKFWCFGGKCKFIELIINRYTNPQTVFYNTEWKKMSFTTGHFPIVEKEIEKPLVLNKMIEIAEKLSEGFIHVRVDLYLINNKNIKFGEMTFTPSSGAYNWNPPEINQKIGNLLELPEE